MARKQVENLKMELDEDAFMRRLIGELAGALQEVVGLDDAKGFVSVVGLTMGRHIDRLYRDGLGASELDRAEVADVLVDLKRRIKGDFYIIEQNDERIVLGNRACPFGDRVVGRPALCMMTSNVFGSITAENLGYAKVEIEQAIATGAPGCRIVVHLRPNEASQAADGRVYFKTFADD